MRYLQWLILLCGVEIIALTIGISLRLPLLYTILLILGSWLMVAWIPIDRKP